MKTLISKSMLLVLIGTMIMGCAVVEALKFRASQAESMLPQFRPVDISGKLTSREYTEKVDNFLVILDTSSSMGEPYQNASKLSLATHFLNNMYQTLPDLNVQGTLRTFGHSSKVSNEKTMLAQAMMAYNRGAFQSVLKGITYPGGTSPMEAAIDESINDLKPTRGQIAVIIVSDWKDRSPVVMSSATDLKNQFGERLCIYPVIVGDDTLGKDQMNKAAQIGQCGFAVEADSLGSGRAMANYVERVFLVKTGDSDGDGVFNPLDQCPGTRQGVTVDSKGCPLDTDGDGVYDYLDQCLGTPMGIKVDKVGCPLDTDKDGVVDTSDQCPDTPMGAKVTPVGCWTYGEVLFDTATAHIKPESYTVLDEIHEVLRKNPAMRLGIEGHTDNQGSEAYNLNLSQERADAVRDYLVGKRVQSEKLLPKGFGFSRPRAGNDTKEGRALNRRVVFTPKY